MIMLKAIPRLLNKLAEDFENVKDPQVFNEIVEIYIKSMQTFMKNKEDGNDSFLSNPKETPIQEEVGEEDGERGYMVPINRDWILVPDTVLICPYCGEGLITLSSMLDHWIRAPYSDQKMQFFKCPTCEKKMRIRFVV